MIISLLLTYFHCLFFFTLIRILIPFHRVVTLIITTPNVTASIASHGTKTNRSKIRRSVLVDCFTTVLLYVCSCLIWQTHVTHMCDIVCYTIFCCCCSQLFTAYVVENKREKKIVDKTITPAKSYTPSVMDKVLNLLSFIRHSSGIV